MSEKARLLVVQVAALGWDLVEPELGRGTAFSFFPITPVFPALTCPVQASLRTGLPPGEHGVVANGFYFRDLRKVLFWEQAASLVQGPRIWESARAQGKRVGMIFWQQSLGEAVDMVLSPRPIHKHSGGMIQDCRCRPESLYPDLCATLGRSFNLMHYWGPLASHRSSDWITNAAAAIMACADAPDLLFAYLPNLDYDLQRRGPAAPEAARALKQTLDMLDLLHRAARSHGWEVCVVGDYAIRSAEAGPIYPNRALRDAGWFTMHTVKGMAYPDFFHAAAFAMVDHEIAHVYVQDPAQREAVRATLEQLDGVERILHGAALQEAGLAHEQRAGDFVLVAAEGHWFAYPWWTDPREAPDYATHIDIHNKPGYDPCELFWGWPPPRVSQNGARVKGTHGKAGPGREVACALTWTPDTPCENHLSLAQALGAYMAGPGES